MKKIIFTLSGRLSIMHPSPHARLDEESEEVFIARVAKDVPDGATDLMVVEETDIPEDRTFRNAWRFCPTNMVKVDMTHARELHKETLRSLRAPKLAALDVEYMRADEIGDAIAKAKISASKQALRDATSYPAINSAKTADELRAALPECLQ